MSNANLAITTAGQADSSLAMILATAGAMIDEINPAMKTIKEGLKENVLKTPRTHRQLNARHNAFAWWS